MTDPQGTTDTPTVVLAVSGGIAAYKACEIVRRLRDAGIRVRVAMTRSATQFVGPTTFAALSGDRVVSDLFADPRPEEIAHVRWAEQCDVLCVAPATADFIAKLAHGIADEFCSTLALAVTAPVLVAPAMEDDMFRHPAVQANLGRLRSRGVWQCGPGTGALASGRSGPGRMAEPDAIVADTVRLALEPPAPRWLAGRKVLVTAGPTREALDPIRVFTNRSSGAMGFALAAEAEMLGAEVVLVTAVRGVPGPPGAEICEIETAEEMAAVVLERASEMDAVVMAAAVADYRPAEVADHKLKKAAADELTIAMARTRDILQELGTREPRPLLVGFAAETDDMEAEAWRKLHDKGCDVIVGNIVGPGRGMGTADNTVVILDRDGGRATAGPLPKRRIAARIWECVRTYDRGEDEA